MNDSRPIPPEMGTPVPTWNTAYYPPMDDMRPSAEASAAGWETLRKLWRRKGLIFGITLLFLVLGVLASVLMTPRYSSMARVLIGAQEQKVTNVESVLKGLTANSETVQSEAFVIASRELARKVSYRLALDKSPEFNFKLRPETWLDKISPSRLIDFEAVSDWFQRLMGNAPGGRSSDGSQFTVEERMWQSVDSILLSRVEVLPLNRSHVLEISAESEEPVMAARIANTFGELYVEEGLVRKQRATSRANQWLETRIAELQKNVQESERAVETFRRDNGLYQTKTDTIVAQQLDALSREMVDAENTKAQASAKLSQALSVGNKPEDAAALPSVLQSPNILMLRTKESDLEREAADLASTFTDKHPKMRNIQAQIADVNKKIKEEVGRVISGLRNEERVAQGRVDRAVSRMNGIKNQMGRSNEQTVALRDLERQAEANRKLFESLLQRSIETVDQQNIQVPDAEIISRASVPNRPSFPPSNLIIILAALVGAGLGVLLALLLENMDQTFHTGEEIEEFTGIAPLAMLPLVGKRHRKIGHVIRNPYSTFTDGLRMLSARLSLGNAGNALPGVIMFTSALPGEGKSFTSSSFAQLSALDGRKTILLDLDWKQPTLHTVFGQGQRAGLVDLLNRDISAEEAVYLDPQSGAHVLFAGNVGLIKDISAWVERLRMLLQSLSRHYDVVILDMPPVMFSPEVLYLARLVDKTILTVKWGSTPRRVVASELKNLVRAGVAAPGIVLSQVDPQRYSKYSYDDGGYLRHRYLTSDAR